MSPLLLTLALTIEVAKFPSLWLLHDCDAGLLGFWLQNPIEFANVQLVQVLA